MSRTYVSFDPTKGYPCGARLFYECLRCGDVLPSMPPDAVMCSCRNIRFDIGRCDIAKPALARLFRE